MQSKQAESVLSDLLMKCEETGVALPADEWDALDVVLAAIRSTKKQEGRQQVEEALSRLSVKLSGPSANGGRKKRAKLVESEGSAASPKAKRIKAAATQETKAAATQETKPAAKKRGKKDKDATIQEQVLAKPAECKENQELVDKFVELGQFEMRSGRTQRGLARMRAAKELRDTDKVITSGAQARKLEHVGPSAAAKVDAILTDGLEGALREYTDKQ